MTLTTNRPVYSGRKEDKVKAFIKLVFGIAFLSIPNWSFAYETALNKLVSGLLGRPSYEVEARPKSTCSDDENALLKDFKSITFNNVQVKKDGVIVTQTLESRYSGIEYCKVESGLSETGNITLNGEKDILEVTCDHYDYRGGETHKIRIKHASRLGNIVYYCETNYGLGNLLKNLSHDRIKLNHRSEHVIGKNFKEMTRPQLMSAYYQTHDLEEKSKIRAALYMLNHNEQIIQSANEPAAYYNRGAR